MRASVAAYTNIVYAVFTFTAFGTVVALASYTVKADSAVLANAAVCTVLAFFATLLTNKDAFRASPAALTDIFRTEFT